MEGNELQCTLKQDFHESTQTCLLATAICRAENNHDAAGKSPQLAVFTSCL